MPALYNSVSLPDFVNGDPAPHSLSLGGANKGGTLDYGVSN